MKILQIITGLNYCGAERMLLLTCRELVRTGHTVHVIYFTSSGMKNEFIKNGIQVTKVSSRYALLPIAILQIIYRIKKQSYDVVHTHLPMAAFIGRFAAKLAGHGNIVNTIHNSDEWLLSDKLPLKTLKSIDRILNRSRQSRCIAITQAVKDHVIEAEGLDPSSIHVIPNSVSFEDMANKACQGLRAYDYSKTGEYIIICVGRLDKQKGHIFLLKALNELINIRNIRDIHCLLIGRDGDMSGIIAEYIIKKNLEAHVKLLGNLENPYPFFKIADLMVIPSLFEGLCIVALEAFFFGVPVLAADVRGLKETVKDGSTGVLFPSCSVEYLADRIIALKNGEYEVGQIVKNAREALRDYQIENNVQKLMNYYRQL